MICYKDRTFCVSSNCSCGRKLTDEIRDAAKRAGMDLSVAELCSKAGAAREEGRDGA